MKPRTTLTIVTIGAVLMMAGAAAARSLETGYELPGLDDLKKEKGVFKTTLIQPGADFSRFDGFHQRTVVLVVESPASGAQFSTGRLISDQDEVVIPKTDEVVEFKRIIGDAVADELARATGLEQVDNAGPGTLIVQAAVTDVDLSSSAKNRAEDGHEYPELQRGTIVFDLIDGESGRVVARFAERRRCKPPKDAEPETGAWPNLTHFANQAAADLGRELERIYGKPAGSPTSSS